MSSLARSSFSARPVPTAPAASAPAAYTWYGADLVSGVIVEELPFVASGPLQSILGTYTSVSGSIALPDCPPNWSSATDPGRTMLVCVRDHDEAVMWAGMVLTRSGGSSATVELSLATLEAYFDRRYVSDRIELQRDGAQIALDLAYDADHVQGIGLQYAGTTTPFKFDRTYSSLSDQTAYSQLTELMRVQDGPEWTIRVDWKDAAKTSFKKTFTTAARIGVASSIPSAVFDMPGSVISYTFTEDFTSRRGANHISMFGDGEGETRPTGTPAIAYDLLDNGWPRFEQRSTRSGVVKPSTLYSHALEELSWKATGAQIFTVTANASTGPILGKDWALGHDVALDVATSPRHPNGVNIIARAIGWELDVVGLATVTPLLEEQDADS
ncbi:hypothetical protein [Kribbella sp. CA-293567]|uniref:hypothetical protein n=1 Tax=Kribbella sp. CA-293567 TaxID=3002436 RepID=UPI0022DE0663|nr:hypothetical protein [Kribbella sp. CA-293567]WBQ03793.1 hypothetical protein OX958_27965 [Kribbella sp. CA-293567]